MDTRRIACLSFQFNGVQVWAYLDSGSSISWVGRDFLRTLLQDQYTEWGPSQATFRCSHGREIPVLGRIILPLAIEGAPTLNHEIFVLPLELEGLALGLTFMEQSRIVINFGAGTVEFERPQVLVDAGASSEGSPAGASE